MADTMTSGGSQAALDLLLEDRRQVAEALWRNEQTGETRVNWFMTIVAAALGGLITLATSNARPEPIMFRLLIVGALLALLALGLVTFLRIVKRNAMTDRFKHDLANMRQRVKDFFDPAQALAGHFPFGRPAEDKGAERKVKRGGRGLGGLAHIVAVLNAVLVTALTGVLTLWLAGTGEAAVWVAGLLGLVAGVGAAWGQVRFSASSEQRVKAELGAWAPTHAGGIVYRVQGDRVEYLLVGPKDDAGEQWLFPKGHIDPGEDHIQAAMREVREETGVVARGVRLAGVTTFDVDGAPVRLKLYAMELCFQTQREERRPVRWVSFTEGLALLTHDSNKAMLTETERVRLMHCNAALRR